MPGTEPARDCDWHRGGRVQLPAEYAEWAAQAPAIGAAAIPAAEGFRIVSPQNGDRYTVPVGGDPRYATIALRATETGAGSRVRWFVDGREWREGRWRLVPGRHSVRAVNGRGASDVVEIEVR